MEYRFYLSHAWYWFVVLDLNLFLDLLIIIFFFDTFCAVVLAKALLCCPLYALIQCFCRNANANNRDQLWFRYYMKKRIDGMTTLQKYLVVTSTVVEVIIYAVMQIHSRNPRDIFYVLCVGAHLFCALFLHCISNPGNEIYDAHPDLRDAVYMTTSVWASMATVEF